MNLSQFLKPEKKETIKRLGLRIPMDLFELVTKYREQDGMSLQKLVVKLLEYYVFDKQEKEKRKAA